MEHKVSHKRQSLVIGKAKVKAILIGIKLPENSLEETINSLNELRRLAETAKIEVIAQHYQKREKIDSKYFVGKGFLRDIQQEYENNNADLVIFDDEPGVSQAINVGNDFGLEIMDRTELILNIFYLHAKTKEAVVQIKLAELQYNIPRLKLLNSRTDRVSSSGLSGIGFATRGSGEKKIDLTRRKLYLECSKLCNQLKSIESKKSIQHKNRQKFKRVCLVGYTNAGKSTLFNSLTKEKMYTKDQLFATLDSTTRLLKLPGGNEVLLSDTIGFIAKLPHSLIASFNATLKEVIEADLLVHVVDLSDPNYEKNVMEVNNVLNEIDAAGSPCILALNKIDKLSDDKPVDLQKWSAKTVFISALKAGNLDNLREKIEKSLFLNMEYRIHIPYSKQNLINSLYNNAKILETRNDEKGTFLRVIMNTDLKNTYSKYLAKR